GPIFRVNYSDEIYSLDGKWLIERDGHEPEFFHRECTLAKGEKATATAMLPTKKDLAVANGIVFISNGCVFKVVCGGRVLYSYGHDEMEKARMIPREVQYIAIPEEFAGKELRISFLACREGSVIDMTGSGYGDVEVLSRMFAQRRSNATLFSQFLIAFGVSLGLLWIVGSMKQRAHWEMLVQGALLTDMGLYVLCYNDLFEYMVRDIWVTTSVEYLTLLALVPLAQAVFIFTLDKAYRKLQYVLLAIDSGILVMAAILQFTGLIHINDYVVHIQVYLILRCIYSGTVMFRRGNVIEGDAGRAHNYLASLSVRIGLLLMMIFFFLDFILWKIGASRNVFRDYDMRGSFLGISGVLLSACLILSYFFYNVANDKESQLKEHLTKLAYSDALTGLASRAACDKYMFNALRQQENGTIISVDLNNLKVINDRDGHQEGDKYISGFAALLGKTFSEADMVARMGGDEFLVYMQGEDTTKAEELLSLLKERVKRDGRFSYSYGFAHTSEAEGNDMHNTYMLADQRMYQMKDAFHRETDDKKEGKA
ncbi:MAG: GGDEF domain-containing protein, partial [Lachnospiraceae bacterium]|nr:GGDEF domain-containing protein [Lachnospiraceae bacterium]